MEAANPLQTQLVSANGVVMGTRKCQGRGSENQGERPPCPDKTGQWGEADPLVGLYSVTQQEESQSRGLSCYKREELEAA